jgi:predicted alpha/beta hydrolase family esterase
MIIAFVNNQVSKVQIDASSLGLDDKQKKDFEKLADEVVKQFNLQANPAIILAVSMGGIYMMNTVLQRSLAEQKSKVSKSFKPEY